MATLNDKLVKAEVVAFELMAKEVRMTLKPADSDIIMWKNKLPFYINATGSIKRHNYGNILDILRECYGIDLTREVKVNKADIFNRNKYLKDRISDLKNSDLSKEVNKVGLEKYKKELATLKNRNTTYNLYVLRKQAFDNKRLERWMAAFLIVTGQVKYIEKDKKYKFYVTVGRYFKVMKPKSYDRDHFFFQKIFRRVYRVEANDRNNMRRGLTEALSNNPNILKKTSVEYNLMYGSVMYSKIKKMASLIRDNDAKLILRSLYDYVKSINGYTEKEDKEYLDGSIEKIRKSFKLRSSGKKIDIKEANSILKKAINTKFLKLFKRNLEVNLKILAEILAPYLVKPLSPYLIDALTPELIEPILPKLTEKLSGYFVPVSKYNEDMQKLKEHYEKEINELKEKLRQLESKNVKAIQQTTFVKL